jgi:hypothetical protein
VLSAILSLGVPLIVKSVERIFGSGGGKAKKLPAAVGMVKAIVERFAEPGVGLPGEEEILGMVQQAVDELNASGALKGNATGIDAATDPELARIGGSLVREGVALLRRSGVIRES